MSTSLDATWSDILDVARKLGRNAFVASVDEQARPHLAIVWLVIVQDVFHFVSDRSAVKARNLAARPAVTAHFQVVEEGPNEGEQLFLRGVASLAEVPARRRELWDSGAWGDLGQWYSGPNDPTLAFIRVDATEASITAGFGASGRRAWRI